MMLMMLRDHHSWALLHCLLLSHISAAEVPRWQAMLGISEAYNPWNLLSRMPDESNPFRRRDRPFPVWLLVGCIVLGLYVAYGDKHKRRRRRRRRNR